MAETATTSNGFRSGWDAIMGIGLTALQRTTDATLAKFEAQKQADVQTPYANLAAASPNLGPNDNRAGIQQATFQTELMQKIDPRSSEFSFLWIVTGVVLLGVFVWIVRRK